MNNVFVSSEIIGEPYCQALIQQLSRAGFAVTHSPINPIDGCDPRWADWYYKNLKIEPDNTQIFVIIITGGWDSSTWMATEADTAKKLHEKKKIQGYYYWNPCQIRAHALGMQPYLMEELPKEVAVAIEYLKSKLSNF